MVGKSTNQEPSFENHGSCGILTPAMCDNLGLLVDRTRGSHGPVERSCRRSCVARTVPGEPGCGTRTNISIAWRNASYWWKADPPWVFDPPWVGGAPMSFWEVCTANSSDDKNPSKCWNPMARGGWTSKVIKKIFQGIQKTWFASKKTCVSHESSI